MKRLQIFVILAITASLVYSCSSRRSTRDGDSGKSSLTGVRPNTPNPSRGVVNASGDGLTPGINSANTNGPGSEENANNIVNNAITRAKSSPGAPQKGFDILTDEDFVNRSAVSEMMEIKMSRIALNKTKNAKIKDYATMILNDHQQIQGELKKLSANKNISLSDSINSGLQSLNASAAQLNSLTETDNNYSDLEYVQAMIGDHQNMIRLFVAGSKSTDTTISAFAVKHLPMLRKHLSAAQELTKEVR